MRTYKKNRASRKGSRLDQSYEAYKAWREKFSTTGGKKNYKVAMDKEWTKDEYRVQFIQAQDAGWKNIARELARSQTSMGYFEALRMAKHIKEYDTADLDEEQKKVIKELDSIEKLLGRERTGEWDYVSARKNEVKLTNIAEIFMTLKEAGFSDKEAQNVLY